MKKIIKFLNNEKYFRLAFLSSLYFSVICMIGFYFYVISCVLVIWGAYLFVKKMIYQKMIYRVRCRNIIYAFLGTCVITSLIHWQDNFFKNMFIVCWLGVCFFFFMGAGTYRSAHRLRLEAGIFLKFIVTATAFVMLTGLILLGFFPQGFSFGGDHFCIYQNRFVGIIYNANITAFYAVMGMICCIILWGIESSLNRLSLRTKIYYIFCNIINILALFLSDSNGSLLLLIVFCSFIAFYMIYKDYRKGFFNFLVRLLSLSLSCIVIVMSLLGTRTVVQRLTTELISISEPTAKISTGVTASNGKVHISDDTEKHEPVTTFKHENKNLDSGRFVIWRQSLQLFEYFPIFGIGKANIELYGERYIGGLKYFDFHNGLITIIISFGLAGFNLFMILAVTTAKTLLKAIFRYQKDCQKDGWVLVLIVAFCAAYCVYSMLEIALLVDLSYKVFIFWFFIGLGLSYSSKYERQALLRNQNLPKRSAAIKRFAKKAA